MAKEELSLTTRWGKQGENWDYVENLKDKEEYTVVLNSLINKEEKQGKKILI